MCSIAGIIRLTKNNRADGANDREALERMNQVLVHRGPDDKGIYWTSNVSGSELLTVGLANTRLSIIDLSVAGHQPMEDKTSGHCLTYNGEVYNYRELRGQLEDAAPVWCSQTDTEVVMRGLQRWGTACLEKLRGMFALAFWDVGKRQLLLARDPFGIKPLYYYKTESLFLFASEVRALLASGLVERHLSKAGLASYLQYGSVEAPLTMIEGVRSVLPGHYLVVQPRGERLDIHEASYIHDSNGAAPQAKSRAEAVDALREILSESIRLHLESDVPLGVFLSGGMDSSALVALMNRINGERPKTFSVVFEEGRFSEARHARAVAQQFETEHHEIHLTEEKLLEMLPRALSSIDQPTMDGINTFVVSKAVKDAGITVALSGLGGDELFAGYSTFRRALRLRAARKFPRFLREKSSRLGRAISSSSVQQQKLWQLLASDGSPYAACAISRQLFSPESITNLLQDNLARKFDYSGNGYDDPINAVSMCELKGYMANTLLRDTDFMSMAHSLEVRVPFVDPVVVRFVLSLPGEWKVDGHRPKPLLQDVLGGLLSEDFLNRRKMGFTLPFEDWMQSRLRQGLDQVFSNETLLEQAGLHPTSVQNIWRKFLRQPKQVGWSRPWALYVLAKWSEQQRTTI